MVTPETTWEVIYSIPCKHSAKKRHNGAIRTFHCTYPPYPTSLLQSKGNQEETPNFWVFPQEEKKKLEHVSHILAFKEAAQGTGFCLIWLGTLTEKRVAHFRCPRSTENKGESCALLYSGDIDCSTADRYLGLLWSRKKPKSSWR